MYAAIPYPALGAPTKQPPQRFVACGISRYCYVSDKMSRQDLLSGPMLTASILRVYIYIHITPVICCIYIYR